MAKSSIYSNGPKLGLGLVTCAEFILNWLVKNLQLARFFYPLYTVQHGHVNSAREFSWVSKDLREVFTVDANLAQFRDGPSPREVVRMWVVHVRFRDARSQRCTKSHLFTFSFDAASLVRCPCTMAQLSFLSGFAYWLGLDGIGCVHILYGNWSKIWFASFGQFYVLIYLTNAVCKANHFFWSRLVVVRFRRTVFIINVNLQSRWTSYLAFSKQSFGC